MPDQDDGEPGRYPGPHIQLTEEVSSEESIVGATDRDELVAWTRGELDDALLALGVYNAARIEVVDYAEMRAAEYTDQELEAIADDVSLLATTGDQVQERLYQLGELDYTVMGFAGGQLLRVRNTLTTGTLFLVDRERDLPLPGFADRYLDEVQIGIEIE